MVHHDTMCGNNMFCGSEDIQKKHSPKSWTSAVTLTLNTVIQLFHRTLQLMMQYYKTKFGCKQTSSLEDRIGIIIFRLYKPSLWPWHWGQWTNFSAWHSGSWCGIHHNRFGNKMIYDSEDIQTNIHWHFEPSLWPWPRTQNPIFPHDTPTYDAMISNQVWLQTDQQCRRYSRNSHILI